MLLLRCVSKRTTKRHGSEHWSYPDIYSEYSGWDSNRLGLSTCLQVLGPTD